MVALLPEGAVEGPENVTSLGFRLRHGSAYSPAAELADRGLNYAPLRRGGTVNSFTFSGPLQESFGHSFSCPSHSSRS
jgi:hypothetical protein